MRIYPSPPRPEAEYYITRVSVKTNNGATTIYDAEQTGSQLTEYTITPADVTPTGQNIEYIELRVTVIFDASDITAYNATLSTTGVAPPTLDTVEYPQYSVLRDKQVMGTVVWVPPAPSAGTQNGDIIFTIEYPHTYAPSVTTIHWSGFETLTAIPTPP